MEGELIKLKQKFPEIAWKKQNKTKQNKKKKEKRETKKLC